jgi:hypothetical protein
MLRKTLFASLLASSAIALAVTTPAQAGKGDRADEAIAAAEAKLHTAESLGTSTEVPRATAEARAALATAREYRAAGHKSSSIQAAIRASALADTAIGELQRRKDDTVAAVQEGASAAQEQAAAAQQQAATAQQQAADANLRADAAQQSAAMSAADAAAARNAATAAALSSPQVETTVTTQQPSSRRSKSTHVTRRVTTTTAPAVPAPSVTTTTRVTQP